jgi:NAD(P)-dependent dehydrogenase (short-subunit alcohol dehydrogenase family)
MTNHDKPVMLIAGGSGSIGSEIAGHAAAAGWRVAIHGRTDAKIAAIIDQLKTSALADAFVGFSADISTPDAIENVVEKVGKQLGRIDAVIDCVATGPAGVIGRFRDTDPKAYAGFSEASIVHLQRLAHAALPWLSRQGGTLIAFASDAGKFAAPHQTMVGASRAGIMGFIRNLALEVARDGVRANCISPSFVEGSESMRRGAGRNASRIEKARARAGLGLPTARDIAPLVLFLCGEGARRITGQVISINGGLNA